MEEKANHFSNPSETFIQKLKEFDYKYNVEWPLIHLQTAQHYLDRKAKTKLQQAAANGKNIYTPNFNNGNFSPTYGQITKNKIGVMKYKFKNK